MGNSPSKNDPLPNTSALRSAGSSSDMIAGDVESDETSASPLSRPTGNGRNTPRESRDSRTFNSGATAPGQPRASVGGSVSQKSQSAPQNIPARGSRERRKSSHGSDPDLSMDIDASLALLLSNSASGGASPSAATSGWKKANGRSHLVPNVSTGLLHVPARVAASVSEPGAEYGSSLDSQKSEILSGSPLFTGSERDTSLLLSLYLETGLPSVMKTENPFAAVLKSSLDPIAENSIESTPEPKRTEAKPQAIKKSKLVDSTLVKQQSQAVTPVSLSPPMLPQAKKTDFDIDGIIERLIAIGRNKDAYKHLKSRKMKDKLPLTSQEVKSVLAKSRLIFLDQPSLLKLAPPVKIVGDIHGQFFDLIRIFDSCGYPPYTNYLFLGDYVDRGYKSLEVILLLLCYKIKYPENFFMLRGNHESANITKIYGFYDECKRRLPLISGSHKLWKCFIDVFNTLPIAATINDKIFCIHGGLSPELHSLKQVEQIQRPTDIPDRGLLADLLWSDPDASVRTFSLTNWPKNDRGVSYCFGKKHVDYFLSKFNMDLIVRGHMVVEDGYEFFNKRKLVTVFLAPNYCGDFNNYGAVMSVDKSLCCSFELIKPQ